MALPRRSSASFRPQLEQCEPRLLLTADLGNDTLEIGTNLNFLFQEEQTNLLSQPSATVNPNGTLDTERRPFAFRNSVDWENAYNFDSNTGLSTTSPWRQEFLDDLNIYSNLRFIHWTNTNGSGISNWGERTLPNTDQTQLSRFGTSNQAANNGVAWEWLIDLGNRLEKDIWINIPLKADNDYVENLASLIQERLDPNLTVYVEYHNEIWLNKQISEDSRSTSEYATDMAIAHDVHEGTSGFNNVLRWYAHRSAEIWKTFRTEFGTSFDSRVVKVAAGQTANENVGEQIRDNLRDDDVNKTEPMELEDTYAIAPYFASIEQIAEPVDFDFIDSLAQAQVAQAAVNVAIWDSVGTPVISYEGGQSMTGANTSDAALQAINFDPAMKDIYLDYLEGLEDAGLESFNHFTHSGAKIAPDNNSDDAWGAKAYIGQPASEAPKYAALAEFAGIEPLDGPPLLFDGAIVSYDAAGSQNRVTTSIAPQDPWISQVTPSPLTAGPGVTATNGFFNNSFAPNGWDSTTLADAISSNDYIGFSVDVEAGHELDVNALEMIIRSQNQARSFALLSSVTGFSSSAVISDLNAPSFASGDQQAVSIDLDQTPGLQGLTGVVEFRIYAYGGTPTQFESVGVGDRPGLDFTLSGQVRELESTSTLLLVDELLGTYETTGSRRLETTDIEAESSIVPVAVSPVSSGPGITATNAWYNNRFAPRDWQSVTLADAIATDEYLTFSVDVAEGYSLDLSTIETYLFTQNQRARNFSLLSSVDGFAVQNTLSDYGGPVTGSSAFGQEERTATVNLTELTGSTEFRIYVFGSQNTNKWEAVGLGNRIGEELALTGSLTRVAGGPEVIFDGPASEFDTRGAVRNASQSLSAENTSSLFTTSDLTPGPGLNETNGWYNNRFAPIRWNSATLEDAIANDDYLTFSLTVADGVSVDLTEIDAYLFTQNRRSRTFSLLSDATGFDASSVLTDFGGTVTGAAANGQEARSADLTSAGLQNLSGTIEFRIYVHGHVNVWEAVGLGNRTTSELKLIGNVSL